MTAKFILVLATFYHIMATVASMMAVFHFARIMRSEESKHPLWRHVFNWGETHLWISGAILIGVGIYLSSLAEYLNNPKLWTKVSLILLWGASSYSIKKTIQTASTARRNLMFGISIGSLLYGTFLGVAKPLAYGVLPFSWFVLGFVLTVMLSTLWVSRRFPPVRRA